MATRRSSIIGVFDDKETAEQAITMLQGAGFNNNQISYASNVRSPGFLQSIKHLFTGDEAAAPDDLYNDFTRMGVPQDEAAFYAHEYEAGHSIVAIQPGARMNEAENILRRSGAHGYGMKSNQTTGTGYERPANPTERAGYERPVNPAGPAGSANATQTTGNTTAGLQGNRSAQNTDYAQAGYNNTARETGYAQPADNLGTDETRSLKLREEQLRAEKERVQTGEVRLHKEVVTEQQTINVPVTHEEVVIERRAITGDANVTDMPIGEGETIRIPISEERVNITKTPITTGEVSIEKREVEENREITDTVRRERARLEQQGNVTVNNNWEDDQGSPKRKIDRDDKKI